MKPNYSLKTAKWKARICRLVKETVQPVDVSEETGGFTLFLDLGSPVPVRDFTGVYDENDKSDHGIKVAFIKNQNRLIV